MKKIALLLILLTFAMPAIAVEEKAIQDPYKLSKEEQEKLGKLPPASRDAVNKFLDQRQKTPQKVKDEIKKYKQDARALREKLSPEAKEEMKQRKSKFRELPQDAKDFMKDRMKKKHADKAEKKESAKK